MTSNRYLPSSVIRTLLNLYDGAFLPNELTALLFPKKGSNIDVWQGSIYNSGSIGGRCIIGLNVRICYMLIKPNSKIKNFSDASAIFLDG